jgi:hypothetical protein
MTLASCSIYKLFYYIPTFLSFGRLVGFGEELHFWSTIAVWHLHWWHSFTVLPGIYFMVFLQFFHLTDWYFGFGQEPFLGNNCSVTFALMALALMTIALMTFALMTFALMTFAYCPTWYLFYGFPTVFPFDGLVLWVRTGAISCQQLQCEHLLHHQQQAGEIIRRILSVFVNKYSEQILFKSSIMTFK